MLRRDVLRLLVAVLCGVFFSLPASAVVLEQIISREHPDFDQAVAVFNVGQDGNIYLTNRALKQGYDGFLLRVSPDGAQRTPAITGNAGWGNATANAAGIVASTHEHFTAQLRLHDKDLKNFAFVPDFLNNDALGYDSPGGVEAGQSGDFYALGQNQGRILRVSPQGKLLKAYVYPAEYGPLTNKVLHFALNEPAEMFWLAPQHGPLVEMGFDGKERKKLSADVSGGWCADEHGAIYTVGARSDTVKKFSPDGEPAGEIKLLDLKDLVEHPIVALQVHGNELFIRRNHPTEMFRRHAIGGQTIAAVATNHERLTVEFPSLVWTAGKAMSFTIGFEASGKVINPRWRVWARPMGMPRYLELPLKDGQLQVPANWAGLYVLKVSPETQDDVTASEYLVREVVEVRAPDSHGTANVLTPDNRVFYGRGEAIPLQVIVRAAATNMPSSVVMHVVDKNIASTGEEKPSDDRVVASETIALQDGKAKFEIPATLSAAMRPGEYYVETESPGLTTVGQTLVIGPGLPMETPYWRMLFGDYGGFSPGGTLWDSTENAAAHVRRSQKLNLNLFVERLGHLGSGMMGVWAWPNNAEGNGALVALKERLQKDPLGIAPEKADLENAFRQTMAAYSAAGIRESAILMFMDAGLPIGTGFDARKPEQFQKDIRDTTNILLPYSTFRSWTWAANWWIWDPNKVFQSDQEKQQYADAQKKTRETGEWNPILDTISARKLSWQTDAQEMFGKALHDVAPASRVRTAGTGPYRRPDVYPPTSFANVDEVDLHLQYEQIGPPQWPPHGVDYYKRPGKPALGHPEIWNDSGTGDQILTSLFQMAMRGADGVGQSGIIPNFGSSTEDSRSGSSGLASVHRAAYHVMSLYGKWIVNLKPNDPIAIVVSRRQSALDEWTMRGFGGEYFMRQFEAYQSCLAAHRPATFFFIEDIAQRPLTNFKAALVVGQTVEMEAPLKKAIDDAKAAGVRIFSDGTCRPTLVKDYTPLGVTFDAVATTNTGQDDSAFWRYRDAFVANAPIMEKTLGPVIPAIAGVANPEIQLTAREGEGAHYLFVLNNTMPSQWNPGQLWRVTMAIATRVPLQTTVQLSDTQGKAVYDVFAMQRLQPEGGIVAADLRDLPMRIFAVLPKPIGGIKLRGPAEVRAGQQFNGSIQVCDEAGAAIDALVPLQVQLLDGAGKTIEQRVVSAGKAGASVEMRLPLGADGAAEFRVTELLSGKSATLTMKVVGAAPLASLAIPSNSSANNTIVAGKAMNVPAEPVEQEFGPHVRDVALLSDGKTAVLNTFNWNHNLYAIDTENGNVTWRQKVGDYYAFDPEPTTTGGLTVQGFDILSGEGYHAYLLNAQGQPQRRFALMGLPERLPHWSFPTMLQDRINNFATAPDGGWVISGGDLGLAAFDAAGKTLWQMPWPAGDRTPPVLAAADNNTLVCARGIAATAYDARTGKQTWQLNLANTGEVQEIISSADHNTLAVRATTNSGTVFLVRAGKIVREMTTPVERIALSPDGNALVVTVGKQLKLFTLADGLQWTFTGDDKLHFPRVAADGRIVASSDLGTVYVFDASGKLVFSEDARALAVPRWMPGGDLLLATWMGDVSRRDAHYALKWRSHLHPAIDDPRANPPAPSALPTAAVKTWINADPERAALSPNLLTTTKNFITFTVGDDNRVVWENDPALLSDGQETPPPKPWIAWPDIQMADSGWRGSASLIIDTYRTQLHLKGITFVEDPAHPESWLRNVLLQYWNAATEAWVTAQPLLSDSATHTHWLKEPIDAAKFRIVAPPGAKGWPVGNIRLSELVLHGDMLGCSHPDAAAKKPVAVLFEEQQNDLRVLRNGYNPQFDFALDDAYSGGKSLLLKAEGAAFPVYQSPFGHAVPDWDFEIAEKPEPGQYRYLQWAWKAKSEKTDGAKLRVGYEWPGPGFNFVAGSMESPLNQGVLKDVKIADALPKEWTVVRVDLWTLVQEAQTEKRLVGPLRIRSLMLSAHGGGAAFDQLLLGRTAADLDALAKPK